MPQELQPWEVPGAEYQGWGNPYASWWGGGSIPMDDPRRAEAARALYEQTGRLYTPFSEANPTLAKDVQAYVDRINQQGQFRFGDDWETYYFDPTKFLEVPLTDDSGRADYSQFKAALNQDIQNYYQQYDPESLNWRDEAISGIAIDMYQNKGETYEDYLADRTERQESYANDLANAERLGLTYNQYKEYKRLQRAHKRQQGNLRREAFEEYIDQQQAQYEQALADWQASEPARLSTSEYGMFNPQDNQAYMDWMQSRPSYRRESFSSNPLKFQGFQAAAAPTVEDYLSGNYDQSLLQSNLLSQQQEDPRGYAGLPQSPYANMNQNTMFGQNQASQQVTQSSLLNNLSSTINSQRAAILNNLFGK